MYIDKLDYIQISNFKYYVISKFKMNFYLIYIIKTSIKQNGVKLWKLFIENKPL